MGARIYWIIIKTIGGFCRFFIQDGGLQDCAKSKHKRKVIWGLLTRLGLAYALLISSSAKIASLYGGLNDGGLQDSAQVMMSTGSIGVQRVMNLPPLDWRLSHVNRVTNLKY